MQTEQEPVIKKLAEQAIEIPEVTERKHPFDIITKNQRVFVLIPLGILAGLCFNWLHVPVGWLLGPMMLGLAYCLIKGNAQPLPPNFLTVAKAFLGVATAVRCSPETLSLATAYAIPLLVCVLITGSLSIFKGYLLSRWTRIDRTTSFLASIPGAATGIIAMSEEMGADAVAVTVLQSLRLLLLVMLMPLAANVLFPHDLVIQSTAIVATGNRPLMPIWLNLVILGVSCTFGNWIGNRLRLPSSGFLGSFVIGLAVSWLLPYRLAIPKWLFNSGLLLVGLCIGLRFDRQTAEKLRKVVLIEICLVTVLILACLGIGYEFHQITGVDTITSVLGFAPGMIEAMIATVMQLGGDPGLAMAMQMTRILLIIAITPWLAKFLMKNAKSSLSQLGGKKNLDSAG